MHSLNATVARKPENQKPALMYVFCQLIVVLLSLADVTAKC